MYSKIKIYLILFSGVFALSTSAIWVKAADASSAVVAFYRLLIAAAVLFPFMLFSREKRTEVKLIQRSQWIRIISAGLCLALHYVLWFESLNFTSVSSSTVLVCLQPLFSLFLERFVMKTKIKSTAMFGCIIALCGSAIIGFGDLQISAQNLFGDILAFVAAGIIALYFFIGQNVRKDISAVTYSTLSYLVSATILFVYVIIQNESFVGYTQKTWIAFVGLGLIATIGGQFVFNILLKKLPASAVTMSILGEPIGTCILAYLILHESIKLQQFIGMAIIMIGMIVFFFLPARKKRLK